MALKTLKILNGRPSQEVYFADRINKNILKISMPLQLLTRPMSKIKKIRISLVVPLAAAAVKYNEGVSTYNIIVTNPYLRMQKKKKPLVLDQD